MGETTQSGSGTNPETKLARRAPAERKAAILHSAQELFRTQGVETTSIESIARQAGVAKGTVYLYFPSQEHLVGELEILFNSRITAQGNSNSNELAALLIVSITLLVDRAALSVHAADSAPLVKPAKQL